MQAMKALLIQIYQPTAHFRIPFTYQRRHTYPIPPYSTVIGLLCNLLGIYYHDENDDEATIDDNYVKLKKCKISISGHFDQKLTEYIWFRNLNKESHKTYFGSETIREKNGEINHIGGQVPMKIDVLENLKTNIYIFNEDETFLKTIQENIKNPINRLDVIHLGRAEDWLVFDNIEMVDIIEYDLDKDYKHFFWIPQNIYYSDDSYNETFYKSEGIFYNLPIFATIKGYNQTYDKNGERSFTFMKTKLNNGALVGLKYLYDETNDLPVFLADL
jgi:CRISPR-associated protein Cas5t